MCLFYIIFNEIENLEMNNIMGLTRHCENSLMGITVFACSKNL